MSVAFEVVAEPHRRQMLDLLRNGPRNVSELVDAVGLSQPGTSKHLRVMLDAGVVTVRAEGRQRIYELRPEPLREIEEWITPYRALWSRSSTGSNATSHPRRTRHDGSRQPTR